MLSGAIRIAALAARMFLAIVVVRYLGPAELAAFAIIQAVVVIASRVVGFGVGLTAGRRIAAADVADGRRMLAWQMRFLIRNYAILVVGCMLALPFLDNPGPLLWTVAILVPAHLASELYQNLLYGGDAVAANAVVALVNGLWAIPVLLLFVLLPQARSLESLLCAWLLGSAAGAAVALHRTGGWRAAFERSVRQSALPERWGTLMPGYLCHVFQFLILYLDRLVAGWLMPADAVGIYVLHWSIGYGAQTLVFSMVAAQLTQKLRRAHQTGDHPALRQTTLGGLAFTVATVTGVLLVALVVWQILGPALVGPHAVLPIWLSAAVFAAFAVRALAELLHVAMLSAARDLQLLGAYLVAVPASGIALVAMVAQGDLGWLIAGGATAAVLTLASLIVGARGLLGRHRSP